MHFIALLLLFTVPFPIAAVAADNVLVLTAPPRESDERAHEIYDPIAKFISHTIGRPVVFQPAGTWGVYQSYMQKDKFDFVLDGPHFVAWRVQHLRHQVLVKIASGFQFIVIVSKDSRAKSLKDLQGRVFCASAPPNLGTLVLLSQFNPSRIPALRTTNGWQNIYKGLVAKKCEGAVLPRNNWLSFDPDGRDTRVVYEHQSYPNNALSASTRVTADEKRKIADALLSPAAEKALSAYRAKYMIKSHFERANDAEYLPLAKLLEGNVGF